jgi:hypothetical protein
VRSVGKRYHVAGGVVLPRRGRRPHRPIAGRSRASVARVEHGNWRVVRMNLVAFQHLLANATDDGVEQRGCLTDQPASVERSMSTPSAAIISDCRYSGR